ncbi:U2 small nuclear ribonucleo protein A [Basidiobolus meristosporus CBS 931.73]|uniref:U2 small nuclear ribonucleoprotein A' n=1 Tax=Basidiobolus meristosporus CBS 931.73 TaxID=1314790 RepID=A0A1Y1XW79_9FUNG|nr:U2 small nuclear ribonucleo protein A [Basidiobolus meristosporus CBS 931.73]|eukprot:ORX89584.1 U2 small nuclear ribonucleo protein A [Basidiobolus meristosporus CBS 931.73]
MKLTADLITRSPSYINAIKDRELDLRGNKIPVLENLGVTKDQNDTIDLTDNSIQYLGNFPLLRRLHTLLLSNNRISRIETTLSKYLPNLRTLVLTNNSISELGDLEGLSGLSKLTYLSLIDNPVTKKNYYRSWLIWKIPTLRVIDFKRVKDAERQEAQKLFQSKNGEVTSLAKSILETTSKTFEPGEELSGSGSKPSIPALGLSTEEQAKIKEAIKHASTLDEIAYLEKQLRSGQMPGQTADDDNEVEMDEE